MELYRIWGSSPAPGTREMLSKCLLKKAAGVSGGVSGPAHLDGDNELRCGARVSSQLPARWNLLAGIYRTWTSQDSADSVLTRSQAAVGDPRGRVCFFLTPATGEFWGAGREGSGNCKQETVGSVPCQGTRMPRSWAQSLVWTCAGGN